MTTRRVAIYELPGWPRLLSEDLAAAYVGVSRNTFKSQIGNPWPEPIRFGRRNFYDRHALDRAVDGLSQPAPQSSEKKMREVLGNDPGGSVEAR